MPLVLVHNDVVSNPAHAWDDVEGVRYHYPVKYQGKVQTGEPFVYYRGVHRAGFKRGPAEYVGHGRIGAVWVDPDRANGRNKAFYCAIDRYERFAEPVAAKVDGINLEDIPPNAWRDGVRPLDPATYLRIMNAARTQPPLAVTAPDPSNVSISASDTLIVPPAPPNARSSPSTPRPRRSKQAKLIGDWAEVIALQHIRATHPDATQVVHRAGVGETPGWDIDFLDRDSRLQRVEVKGTVAGGFTGVEFTAGELRAARAHGEDYWLYLVAGCLTTAPRVHAVRDPASQLATGLWTAAPILYQLRFAARGVDAEG